MTSAASGQVDLELKRAFQELQGKMVATQQQLKVSDMQIESLKRQITHSKLVDAEVSALPEGTRTYEGVGRMFILQPSDVVRKNLTTKMETCDEKIKTIEGNKIYLEKAMKESEDNLRELITNKQKTRE